MAKKLNDCCMFIFVDGDIIISEGKFKDYDEVIILNDTISIEPCQFGPTVCVYNDKDINTTHTIPDTIDFMKYDPDGIYSKYLALTNGCMK